MVEEELVGRLAYGRCCGTRNNKSEAQSGADSKQVFSAGTTVVVILSTQVYGWNVHVWDLMYSQMEVGRQVSLHECGLLLLSVAKNE